MLHSATLNCVTTDPSALIVTLIPTSQGFVYCGLECHSLKRPTLLHLLRFKVLELSNSLIYPIDPVPDLFCRKTCALWLRLGDGP